MIPFDQYLTKQVDVELSGKIKLTGILIDYGLDIVVLYNGRQYLYIPLGQIHHVRENLEQDSILSVSAGDAPMAEEPFDNISYRKILSHARGKFIEIFVTGNQTLHGYVTSILTDYFVFYSPVYKTMFISLYHVKWLSPYTANAAPYTLGSQHLPVQPISLSLPRTFTENLKKLENNLVIFDIGDHPRKIGLLQKVENNMIELVTGEGEKNYWNEKHLKTVHLP
ncbi:hypothetical protein [Brevibacillus massiliensis]|uniref:hypothetical protein n=1 Tax=Brevibacillus massiliensis TaxID=1118054 RepID=UPI000302E4FB|nr:hypothetical protein [Brevibacillus massiliensis]